jgi:hypothetical protein
MKNRYLFLALFLLGTPLHATEAGAKREDETAWVGMHFSMEVISKHEMAGVLNDLPGIHVKVSHPPEDS